DPPEGEDVTAEELLGFMRQADVQQALLVPHPQSSYDNSYCIESAQRYPDSFVAIGKIDGADSDAGAIAMSLADQRRVGGLRIDARGRRDPLEWLSAAPTVSIWRVAALSGLTISLPPCGAWTICHP